MLEAGNITKTFRVDGRATTTALDGVSLSVGRGEFVSLMGRSGSGKSTLLNILSTLLEPDSGSLAYQGRDVAALCEKERNALRHGDFAVVFQFHYLLPYLTALENTLLPFMASARPVSRALVARGRECLARVGLEGKADRLPSALSGGEQQRVAIARGLVKNAKVLFADEPTGSLDKKTGQEIMALLRELHRDGLAVVMVTHDPEYAAWADRVVHMQDGRML